ncbi:hypothetical protein JL721_8691 [Aureococcus anophagefferens]|nr:hypothetical protein JL721_8691 [Aureococcus anophagefferens]
MMLRAFGEEPRAPACGASTLLKLFAKRFALDWAALALRPPEGALLLAGDRVVFGDELSVFTVVLAPAPEAAEPLSAHATVAVYDGAAGGRATSRVARYLRYAAVAPHHAEGLQETFAFDVAAADAQTRELADETTAALSAVVAAIPAGARVELEWVQLAMPGRPRRVVRQVQKLEALTEAAEAALARRYPAPRLMMRGEVAKGAVFELEAALCAACSVHRSVTVSTLGFFGFFAQASAGAADRTQSTGARAWFAACA